MPKGTPISLYCRKCRYLAYPNMTMGRDVRRTGRVERRVTWSGHRGTGSGGASFHGHRGEVECRTCGRKWFSTHPNSGRLRESEVTAETVFA